MKTLNIPVHSFIDVITNSSSEVFITSDRKTVDSIKQIVNAILTAGGSDKKCDDLFGVVLERRDGGYGDYNAILVTPKDPNCKAAAELITGLNEVFTIETIGND